MVSGSEMGGCGVQEEEREGDVDYAVDPKALQEAKGSYYETDRYKGWQLYNKAADGSLR